MVPNIQPCLGGKWRWKVKEKIQHYSHPEGHFAQNCWDPKETLLLHFKYDCIFVCGSHNGIRKLYPILNQK